MNVGPFFDPPGFIWLWSLPKYFTCAKISLKKSYLGVGDICDSDKDDDGILDVDDNCLLVSNVAQVDTDGNGVGKSIS